MEYEDTIVAIATPPGCSGVGVLRVSGSLSVKTAYTILNKLPKPRYAEYLPFHDKLGNIIDYGIALFFPGPKSFTGEDIIEFQSHGSPAILDLLLKNIISISGIRIAKPGEFSERAFLNNKLDLLQLEAIDDLIHANTYNIVKLAMNSLNGSFSNFIKKLINKLTDLRVDIEKSIDFPELECELISTSKVEMDKKNKIDEIIGIINEIILQTKQNDSLNDNVNVVIIGKPNVGKSSLLNAILKEEVAIVSSISGTTRDAIHRSIFLNGIKINIVDTAGLKFSDDKLEQISINRTYYEIKKADYILLVTDICSAKLNILDTINSLIPDNFPYDKINLKLDYITIICNKSDITGESIGISKVNNFTIIKLSAKLGDGINLLLSHLKNKVKLINNSESFLIRYRHLDALKIAIKHLVECKKYLSDFSKIEFIAEELILAQKSLQEIIGEFTSNDLLNKIFSKFCIGK